MLPLYEDSEAFAGRLDERDPLRKYRARFEIPRGPEGDPAVYFNGNSLGLMPKSVRVAVTQELNDWASHAVEGHFKAAEPWFSYHERFREPVARLVGALPEEVVVMNGLTVNLHLMMTTFYRPTRDRFKILIEDGAFPSDAYAAASQLKLHGFEPEEGLIRATPRDGESVLHTEDVLALLEERGGEIALVLLPGVQYYTGQLFDLAAITAAAHAGGCVAGWDLAHAVGNVPLELHAWEADFAVWCSYKYLNAGPGAIAGCFVHERHGKNAGLLRMAGWWGNDPATRFEMDREREFVPREGADGWQLSNPPILAMAPLAASLEIFDGAGMEGLRRKSVVLTGYLEWLLGRIPGRRFEILTPTEPERRGCQLSLRMPAGARETASALEAAGIVVDFRPPDVLRVAPVPLYNTFGEVRRFVRVLAGGDGARP